MHRGLFSFLAAGLLAVAAHAAGWTTTTWNGEPAWESRAGGWRAVVSASRARLMHFGPDGSELNLLLAPPTRENRNRLGGHRLWLGPQTDWKGFWPPPAAWEHREAESVAVEAGVLRLAMAPTDNEWPRLVRSGIL